MSGLQKLFSQVFAVALVIRITFNEKLMDLPVYGEANGTNFILNS